MRTRFLLCGTIAAALLAAGCGGDNSSPATTVTTTAAAPTTTSGATTTATATVEESATAALLTPAEVGPGFAADTWTANDPNQPTPCGTPSADASVPAAVQVGTVIGLASTSQALQEEISVYNDEEEAGQAYTTGSAGLSCTTGTVTFDDGTKASLAITPPVDVTSEVGGDEAKAWQLQGGGVQGVLVAVKLAGIVVTFQFIAPDTATDLQPDPLVVAKAGMDKILKS